MLAEKILVADASFLLAPAIGVALGYYFRAARFGSILAPAVVVCAFFEIMYLVKQDAITVGVVGAMLLGFAIDFCIVLAFAGVARLVMRDRTQ